MIIDIGDEKGREFDKVGPPIFSHDGSKLAYAAELAKKVSSVVDGRRDGSSRQFHRLSSAWTGGQLHSLL